jgi:hypothetical protein
MENMITILPEESNEESESYKIEDKIYDMLNKVMEENDSLNSFDFDEEEFEDESFKINRFSKRHQTSDQSCSKLNQINDKNHPFNLSNFNRGNKRNLTEVLNNQNSDPSSFNTLNGTSCSSKNSLFNNPSFCVQNNSKSNNRIFSNFFQNSIQNQNWGNAIDPCNNINQSFQSSQNSNSQFKGNSFNYNMITDINFNNNAFNNHNNNSNFVRNAFPYSKTVVYNNQKDVFDLGNSIININQFENNNNNLTNLYNGNNNRKIPLNLDSSFKRRDKRKKTYDIPLTLRNNLNNYLNFNNNFAFNNNQIDDLFNNKNNNREIKNNDNHTNNCVMDSFVCELKNILDKTGKIDYHIYNLIKGKFLSIIKNHKGSKLFQKYFKSFQSDEIIHLLYLEVCPNLDEFITDPYANYFCKKFFSFLNQKDRIDFLKKIEKSIISYSCDSIGTYPIQTIIESLISKLEKNIIISSIKDHIEVLIYDPFGCHVLEKILTFIEEEYISFIYSYIYDNFLKLAYNSNGICTIKKLLALTQEHYLHNKIKIIIINNSYDLIQHPYGNFVIQGIVESWRDYRDIINLYKNKFFELSLEKYASNVIERFIEKDEEILNEYIDEIVKTDRTYEVMKSSYGNYVIQKALKISNGEHRKKLVFNAAKDIDNLIENKLIQKWKSLLFPYIQELTLEQLQVLNDKNYFEKIK